MSHKNRKYEYGNDNYKKKKKIEELIQSQVGAFDEFLIKDNVFIKNDNIDSVSIENDNVVSVSNKINNIDSVPIENDNIDSVPIENDSVDNVSIGDEVNNDDIFDPRNWDRLQPKLIDLLVAKGPKRYNFIVRGPGDNWSSRFTTNLYTRALKNEEKCDRDRLVYS
ncbi:unnamed protein product [Lathyrus oleraceus]